MQPVFIINDHDYTPFLAEEGLKPTKNDLDADGSGRNLLDGRMYRSRITTVVKCTVTFLRLDEATMAQLEADVDADFVTVTMLDAKEKRYITRTYYSSTINEGVQRFIGGQTVYDGVTFNITER